MSRKKDQARIMMSPWMKTDGITGFLGVTICWVRLHMDGKLNLYPVDKRKSLHRWHPIPYNTPCLNVVLQKSTRPPQHLCPPSRRP